MSSIYTRTDCDSRESPGQSLHQSPMCCEHHNMHTRMAQSGIFVETAQNPCTVYRSLKDRRLCGYR